MVMNYTQYGPITNGGGRACGDHIVCKPASPANLSENAHAPAQCRTYLQPNYGNGFFWQCLPFSWTTLRGKHC